MIAQRSFSSPVIVVATIVAASNFLVGTLAADHPTVLSLRAAGDEIVLTLNQPGGVYRSSDQGRTWTNVGGGLPQSPLYFIEVDPRGHWWAGTEAGLSVSDDRGASWQPVESEGWCTVSRRGRLMFVHWVNDRTVLARTWVDGLFRSTDGGDTWSKIADVPARSHVTSIVAAADGTLWAATFGGSVFCSRDDGARWESAGDGLGDHAILCVAADANGTLWAGTYGDGVYRRQSNEAWQPIADGLPPHSIVQSLAIGRDGRVWVGTQGHGLFVHDEAQPWQVAGSSETSRNITALLPRGDRLLIGTQSDGLSEVNTGSNQWSSIPLRIVVASLAEDADGRIFAALEGGPIVVSVDEGRTWRSTPTVPGREPAVLLAAGNRLLAGTIEGLFISADGADTWRPVPLPDGAHNLAYLADAGESTLFAGRAGEQQSFGLLRSTDGGASWGRLAQPPQGRTPAGDAPSSQSEVADRRAPGEAGDRFQFCLTAESTGRVAVGTDRGLYDSIDRGRTWTYHFFSYGVFHAALDRRGVLYAASMNGLFRKSTYDAQWMPIDVVGRDTLTSSYERVFALPDGRLLANGASTDLLTLDKDSVWTPRNLPEFGFGRLRCALVVDDRKLLVGGPNGLMASDDGGSTWSASPITYSSEPVRP